MNAETVTAAVAVTTELLASPSDGAGGRPTPCRDWDVDALTGHVRQVLSALDLAGHSGEVPADHWGKPSAAAGLSAGWSMPSGTVRMGDMVLRAEQAVAMLVSDLVLHGWDLSRAVGRVVTWDDAAIQVTYDFVEGWAGQAREMNLFGAAVPVPAEAPLLDRALGLSGRDPARGAAIG